MMVPILRLALAILALVSIGSPFAFAQQSLLGELYGMGVHAYNSQDYEAAHEYLTSAIDQGSEDPRCYFFRGLTSLALNRSDEAEADFELGAELEYGDSDRSYPVGTSLHRVQGANRLVIEEHRRTSRVAALQRDAENQETNLTRHRGNEDHVLRDPSVVPATEELPIPEGDIVDPFGDSDLGDTTLAPSPQVIDEPNFVPTEGAEGPSEEFLPVDEPDETDLFNPSVDNSAPLEETPEVAPFFPDEPGLPGDVEHAAPEEGGGVVGSIFGAFRRALPRVTVPELPGLAPGDEDFPPGAFQPEEGADGGIEIFPGDNFGGPEDDPFPVQPEPAEGDAQIDPFSEDGDSADDPFDNGNDPIDDLFGD